MISTSSSIDKANIAKLKVFEESVANNLAANMVSRWKLDQINYPAVNQTPDAWASNTGTLYGTNGLPQLRPSSECVSDGCLLFDGVDDNVNCGNSSSLLFSSIDEVTISLWFKKPSIQSTYPVLFGRGDWNTSNSYSIHTYSNMLNFSMGLSWGGGVSILLSNIQNDVWYNVVGTATATQHRLYVNGNLANTKNTNKADVTSTDSTFVGSGRSGVFFKGQIDDVRIYNSALSSSQIKQNYIAGINSLLSKGSISKEDYNERINTLAYDN